MISFVHSIIEEYLGSLRIPQKPLSLSLQIYTNWNKTIFNCSASMQYGSVVIEPLISNFLICFFIMISFFQIQKNI